MAWADEYFTHYRDYPIEVVIETTGRCNARCVFCPHHTLERRSKEMPDELFERIVRQLEEIPQGHLFHISPFKVNEFLMDKKIFERIALLNERLPNAYIRIFSNFNAAQEADIERIFEIRNLSDIDISVNSLDPEEYHALMGLKLDRTLDNLLRFLARVREQGLVMRQKQITLSRVAHTPETDAKFLEDFAIVFRDYIDLLRPLVIPRGEWIDFLPSEAPLRQNQPCARWANVEICCDGTVAFCCMDGRAAYPLGSVWENTVLEIYNQPMYRRLRTQIPEKCTLAPCKFCSQ